MKFSICTSRISRAMLEGPETIELYVREKDPRRRRKEGRQSWCYRKNETEETRCGHLSESVS